MKRRRDAGFSLAVVIFLATALSIMLAVAVPAYQMQAKREVEAELIFRGEEYMRAIRKYQRRFGIYPPSIDALVETNGLRFLRRQYKDPITEKEFRLITINPDGTLSGSTLANQRIGDQPLFVGQGQTFGQSRQQVQQLPGVSGGISQQQQSQQQGLVSIQGQAQSSRGQQSIQGQQNPQGQQPSGGSGIVGVASDSEEESIKVYNQRQRYNEWEFIAVMQPGQGPQGQQDPQQNPQNLQQSGSRQQRGAQQGGQTPFDQSPQRGQAKQPGKRPQ